MPRIFELFGYPQIDTTLPAKRCRKRARCPFSGKICDGGGNRYSSHININSNLSLRQYFHPGVQGRVAAGICSISLSNDEPPWIVCPRRLLVFSRSRHLSVVAREVLKWSDFSSGQKLGVWSEVKIQFTDAGSTKFLDYTFDYILMPIGNVSKRDFLARVNDSDWPYWDNLLRKAGYEIDNGQVKDFPSGNPLVIEIMTSSTSGGNKVKGTTIAQAFANAILKKEHNAPNINKRQVWARMASQLVAKSEIANYWGGKALWIIQDVLAKYISQTTALDLGCFTSQQTNEVNLLSFSYAKRRKLKSQQYARFRGRKRLELKFHKLYAGPIASQGTNNTPCFQDIIRSPIRPPIEILFQRLAKTKFDLQITVP